MTSFIVAGVFIVVLLALVVWGAFYATKPRRPEDFEWPATPCKRCGKATLVWGELLAEEPSHRTCDCVRLPLHWPDWEERQEDDQSDEPSSSGP